MNKQEYIIKLACLFGYFMFAGFSAFFTATSLALNLMGGQYTWLIFILVLVVSILAGWCLTNAIKELQDTVKPSRSTFVLNLIGFIIFWAFSFTTNVHYFFVEKQGYSILTKELASAKDFIDRNTNQSNSAIEEQKKEAIRNLTADINNNKEEFEREIKNTRINHVGFGDACIAILQSTENLLRNTAELYNDKNAYVIFDRDRDRGDVGVTQYNRLSGLQQKYENRMTDCLNIKISVITSYFDSKKNANSNLLVLLEPIAELEQLHLPAVLKDGSVTALYTYQGLQQGRVISKMPKHYQDECYAMDGGTIKSFNVYPSERMFDTMSVWGDIAHDRLPLGMTMMQWMIIALIFDIVSFILFYIFRK